MQRQVWKETVRAESGINEVTENQKEKAEKRKKSYEIGSNPFDADYMLLLREQRELEQDEGR